eukprot:SAG22_NODE_10189_length_548_cov_1.216036_1_plen_43_part_10
MVTGTSRSQSLAARLRSTKGRGLHCQNNKAFFLAADCFHLGSF